MCLVGFLLGVWGKEKVTLCFLLVAVPRLLLGLFRVLRVRVGVVGVVR